MPHAGRDLPIEPPRPEVGLDRGLEQPAVPTGVDEAREDLGIGALGSRELDQPGYALCRPAALRLDLCVHVMRRSELRFELEGPPQARLGLGQVGLGLVTGLAQQAIAPPQAGA